MKKRYNLSKLVIIKWMLIRAIILFIFLVVTHLGYNFVYSYSFKCSIEKIGSIICLIIALIVSLIEYYLWSYSINERFIELNYGVIYRKSICIPIDRIKYIDLVQEPITMLLKIKSVKIYTAGGKLTIPGINYEMASFILSLIKNEN